MPLIGWLITSEFYDHIEAIDHWIALLLLLLIGGKMVLGSIRSNTNNDKTPCNPFTLRKSLLLGIATSIDALIAGVAIALIDIDIIDASQLINMLLVVAIIFIVTLGAAITGLYIGCGVGNRLNLRPKAEMIGGIILILIGVKIFIEHQMHHGWFAKECTVEQCDSSTKIVCFNIRYDNSADTNFVWDSRKGAIVEMLKAENMPILGIQEGLNSQVKFIDSALTNYTYIGVGRDDGVDSGEYTAIYFDTTRVVKHRSDNFWLCPTPQTPTIGWDAVCVRMATWGEFSMIDNADKRFFVVNTHFDHVGTEARRRSSEMIIKFVDSISNGAPIILLGDFNAPISDSSLAPILDKMSDSRPPSSDQVPYTYIGFGELSPEAAIIDHIFTRSITTSHYEVITEHYNSPSGQLSDHLPIVVEMKFEE